VAHRLKAEELELDAHPIVKAEENIQVPDLVLRPAVKIALRQEDSVTNAVIQRDRRLEITPRPYR